MGTYVVVKYMYVGVFVMVGMIGPSMLAALFLIVFLSSAPWPTHESMGPPVDTIARSTQPACASEHERLIGESEST
jgi:hypothetical protein